MLLSTCALFKRMPVVTATVALVALIAPGVAMASVTQFGGFGLGNGQFQTLTSLAAGPDGSVYVLDSARPRCHSSTRRASRLTRPAPCTWPIRAAAA